MSLMKIIIHCLRKSFLSNHALNSNCCQYLPLKFDYFSRFFVRPNTRGCARKASPLNTLRLSVISDTLGYVNVNINKESYDINNIDLMPHITAKYNKNFKRFLKYILHKMIKYLCVHIAVGGCIKEQTHWYRSPTYTIYIHSYYDICRTMS